MINGLGLGFQGLGFRALGFRVYRVQGFRIRGLGGGGFLCNVDPCMINKLPPFKGLHIRTLL